jgi:hypothetical protein
MNMAALDAASFLSAQMLIPIRASDTIHPLILSSSVAIRPYRSPRYNWRRQGKDCMAALCPVWAGSPSFFASQGQ